MSHTLSTLLKRLVIALVVIGVVITASVVITDMLKPRETLRLGSGVFRTDIVISDKDREKGLSGRSELSKADAMLFVFPRNDKWGIWMKDMNFPIDIVWLDENKKVVFIKQGADPDNYPETYMPSKNARYIVELAAGTINDKNIRVGSTAEFEIKGEE